MLEPIPFAGYMEIEEMKNEPVAWIQADGTMDFAPNQVFAVGQPFYTHPAKTLTDKEKIELMSNMDRIYDPSAFIDAVLKKASEK